MLLSLWKGITTKYKKALIITNKQINNLKGKNGT